jgi:hypothetical protein
MYPKTKSFAYLPFIFALAFLLSGCKSVRNIDYEFSYNEGLQKLITECTLLTSYANQYKTLADETRKFSPSLSLIFYANSSQMYERMHRYYYKEPVLKSQDNQGKPVRYYDICTDMSDLICAVRAESIRKSSDNLLELGMYLYSTGIAGAGINKKPGYGSIGHIGIGSKETDIFNQFIEIAKNEGSADWALNAEKAIDGWKKIQKDMDFRKFEFWTSGNDYVDPVLTEILSDFHNLNNSQDKASFISGTLIDKIYTDRIRNLKFCSRYPKLYDNTCNDIYGTMLFVLSTGGVDESSFNLYSTLVRGFINANRTVQAEELISNPEKEDFAGSAAEYSFLKSFLNVSRSLDLSREGRFQEAELLLDQFVNSLTSNQINLFYKDDILTVAKAYSQAGKPDKGFDFISSHLERSPTSYTEWDEYQYNPDRPPQAYEKYHIQFLRAYVLWLSREGKSFDAFKLFTESEYFDLSIMLELLPQALSESNLNEIISLVNKIKYFETRRVVLESLCKELGLRGINYKLDDLFRYTIHENANKDRLWEKSKTLLLIASIYIEKNEYKSAQQILGKTRGIISRMKSWNNPPQLIVCGYLYCKMGDLKEGEECFRSTWKQESKSSFPNPAIFDQLEKIYTEFGLSAKIPIRSKSSQYRSRHMIELWHFNSFLADAGEPEKALSYVLDLDNIFSSDYFMSLHLALNEIAEQLMQEGMIEKAFQAISESSIAEPLCEGDRIYGGDMDFRETFAIRFAENGRFDLAFKSLSMMRIGSSILREMLGVASEMERQGYQMTDDDRRCLRAIVFEDPFYVKFDYPDILAMINRDLV